MLKGCLGVGLFWKTTGRAAPWNEGSGSCTRAFVGSWRGSMEEEGDPVRGRHPGLMKIAATGDLHDEADSAGLLLRLLDGMGKDVVGVGYDIITAHP